MTAVTIDRGWHEPGWSVLRAAGPDAVSFINNLSTNDARRLAEGEAAETLFTDVKGRVLHHAVLCRRGDGLDVVVTSASAAALHTHLDRYHIREDLTLSAATETRPVLVWGGDAAVGSFAVRTLGESAALRLLEAGAAEPSDPLPAERVDASRIAHRFPLDGVDIDAKTLPQELARDDALISFTKGCYLGQETVARLDALGQVNRLLAVVACAAGLSVGAALHAGEKRVGVVTSVGRASAKAAPLGLALVRREQSKPGTELTIDGAERATATVAAPAS